MIFRVIAALNRYKTVGDGFLVHSEWIRKLQTPSLLGIVANPEIKQSKLLKLILISNYCDSSCTAASVLSLPFGVFVIVPYAVINLAGPSALLSLLIAFIVAILSG
ncbi:unnamed protein product [Gongylonema pulchrum]|uniref:Sulfate_transp domain-containing protein n=1 Tax=Gongylonema pulchrum TaxID=637853 RepID=A0A183DFM3_9BILA|nr:unnamed protein product [Gongylonema pulchrum]